MSKLTKEHLDRLKFKRLCKPFAAMVRYNNLAYQLPASLVIDIDDAGLGYLMHTINDVLAELGLRISPAYPEEVYYERKEH